MFEKQYKETFSQVVASAETVQEVLNLKNKRNKTIVRGDNYGERKSCGAAC